MARCFQESYFKRQATLAFAICALMLYAAANAQDVGADNVARVVSINRVDIDAMVGAPYSSPIYETGQGETDGFVYVGEVYTRVEIEAAPRPEGYFIFYRDVATPLFDATARYSDKNHKAAANQTLELQVQIVRVGSGARLYIRAPELEEERDTFDLYLRYKMVPSVRFGTAASGDEFHWQLIGNEWNAPIEHFTIISTIPNRRGDTDSAAGASPASTPFAARFSIGKEKLSVHEKTEEGLHANGESMNADLDSAKFTPNFTQLAARMKSSRALQPGETVSMILTVPTGLLDPANAAPPPPQNFLKSMRMPRLGPPNLGGAGVVLALIVYYSIASTLFLLAAGWALFQKADQPGWASLIPYYNIYVLLTMTGKPWWWLLIYVLGPPIPVVGTIAFLVMGVLLTVALAQCFGKGTGFIIGLLLLPFIFYPILAFGDAKYEEPDWSQA